MVINILVALLGWIFVTLVKMQSVKKDFAVAKQEFVFKKFVECEWIGWTSNIVVIIMMALTVKEWINVSPKVADYVTIIFGLGGGIGTWFFSSILGSTKSFIRNIIHVKTGGTADIQDDPAPENKPQ
jgi:hypothetical protein